MDKKSKEYFDSKEYYYDKRVGVLETIKPICEAFGINEYDYIIDFSKNAKCPNEQLILNGQKIGCCCNSKSAVVDELIGYIFIKRWCHNNSLGVFSTQCKNVITRYWITEEV